MPRYAIKVGEIFLHSERPITEPERAQVHEYVRRHGGLWVQFNDGTEARIALIGDACPAAPG